MIKSFYGLRADPFPLSPDHSESFPHDHFVKARDYIDYALVRGDGIVMITGKPGTGKTTLVNDLRSRIDRTKLKAIVLVSTQLEAEDLLRMVAYNLGVTANAPSKALVLQEIMRCLEGLSDAGQRAILVIDEAQDLAVSALEELRLLTNLEHAGRPLLQILLLGQEQLRERIRRPEMEQVHQRIVAAWHLEPLFPSETMRYVAHRLLGAGWTGQPSFAPGVLGVVYAYSGGIPRLINLMCSRLLLRGIVTGEPEVRLEDAELVMAELRDEALTLPDWSNDARLRDISAALLSDPLSGLAASDLPSSEPGDLRLTPTSAASAPEPLGMAAAGVSSHASPGPSADKPDVGAPREPVAARVQRSESDGSDPSADANASTGGPKEAGRAAQPSAASTQRAASVDMAAPPPVPPPLVQLADATPADPAPGASEKHPWRVRLAGLSALVLSLVLLAAGLYVADPGLWRLLGSRLGIGPSSAVSLEARAALPTAAAPVPGAPGVVVGAAGGGGVGGAHAGRRPEAAE
ncbi:AAA ATPase [Thiorhodococcus drewsii AZ1]|uniref:AAA ATPase n=1 Tax=Thiorhodococcus drewsii AZ1 TaxID=765913 RepID=G2E619_9GAMM|nr:AAA family ATPase [Thiorhodococcus drewsii]EGV28504.1 AAA ATPase [Thiorhodococcus drewsii AZ1]